MTHSACRACGGTGVLLLTNERTHRERYRREDCPACEGTGHDRPLYPIEKKTITDQARRRARRAKAEAA